MNGQQHDVRDARILAALDVPRSTREISDLCRQQVLDEWAEEQGFKIEWGTDAEPAGERILAISGARKRGAYPGNVDEVDRRLRRLERAGLVERVQLAGHRPMLWRFAAAGEEKP